MLQQKVTATRFHATTQTFAPLINSVVNDTLLQTGPHIALLQIYLATFLTNIIKIGQHLT